MKRTFLTLAKDDRIRLVCVAERISVPCANGKKNFKKSLMGEASHGQTHEGLFFMKELKIIINKAMHGNFFTRKRITIVEQNFIIEYKSIYPNGYNEFFCFK